MHVLILCVMPSSFNFFSAFKNILNNFVSYNKIYSILIYEQHVFFLSFFFSFFSALFLISTMYPWIWSIHLFHSIDYAITYPIIYSIILDIELVPFFFTITTLFKWTFLFMFPWATTQGWLHNLLAQCKMKL